MKLAFAAKVEESFSIFNFDLVVYDEIEFFREYTSPLFNYPYQKRKNKLSSFSFSADPDRVDSETGGY